MTENRRSPCGDSTRHAWRDLASGSSRSHTVLCCLHVASVITRSSMSCITRRVKVALQLLNGGNRIGQKICGHPEALPASAALR